MTMIIIIIINLW